ncbi:ATP-binding protein [Weissella confusa]|nr:ATP-binding protein [Weissella confusa]
MERMNRHGRKSPFKPSFGSRPDEFIGRNDEIRDLEYAVDDVNSQYRSTLITGLKGFGKTSLLSKFTDMAKNESDIYVVSTSADSNAQSILDDIAEQVSAFTKNDDLKLSKISFGFQSLVKAEFDNNEREVKPQYRRVMQSMFDELDLKISDNGQANNLLLISVDEVQAGFDELRVLATSYQMWVREHYNVMLLVAGLPQYVSWVDNDRAMSFLARSARVVLDELDINLVADMYFNVFNKNNRVITEEVALKMAELTEGFPYAVQLLGSLVWTRSESEVTLDDVETAFEESHKILASSSFQAIDNFSGNLQKVLLAIARSGLDEFLPHDLHDYLPELERTEISRQLKNLREFGLLSQDAPRSPYEVTFKMFMRYLVDEYELN